MFHVPSTFCLHLLQLHNFIAVMSIFILNFIMQKSSHMHKKDGSSTRPKSSLLERSIRELEKMVAECKI